MDKFPVEILYKILAFACFDNNDTGRSLALTSKWMGHVSSPVRLEAVSLCGVSQIIQFAGMLENSSNRAATSTAALGKIRHLFVSDLSRKNARVQRQKMNLQLRRLAMIHQLVVPDSVDDTYDHDNNDEVENDDGDDDKSTVEQKQREFYSAFHRVMYYASPSLHTLFITTYFEHVEAFPPFPMPHLTDFSVLSAHSFLTIPHVYPNLKRIHTDFEPYGSDKTKINFRNYTPALEEIRITNFRQCSGRFAVTVIDHARCIDSENNDNNSSELLFPNTMKRVLLQPCPPTRRRSSLYRAYSFKGYLLRVAHSLSESEHRRTGFRVTILQPLDIHSWFNGRSSGLRYSFDDARKDWTDVLLGGKGCWDDADREDLTKYVFVRDAHEFYDPEDF